MDYCKQNVRCGHKNYKFSDRMTIDQTTCQKLLPNCDRLAVHYSRCVTNVIDVIQFNNSRNSTNRSYVFDNQFGKSLREYKGDVCIQNNFPFL